jgi:hypothetical protein
MTAPFPLDSELVERKASGPLAFVMRALGVLGQAYWPVLVVVAVEAF